ncbi:Hypothetical_protein [Hexamita inflata]|uniref:Hypothetical_protein n=3 Tax=Hexamita inflata TaxID=28002 RepID=A0AA86UEE0_9EUKA|nr:Hypothetical protein HINF_LOCUS40079 [Hexamita inflata]
MQKAQTEKEMSSFLAYASQVLNIQSKNGTIVSSEIMQLSEVDYQDFWSSMQTAMNVNSDKLKSYFIQNIIPHFMITQDISFNQTQIQHLSSTSSISLNPKQVKCYRSSMTRHQSELQLQTQMLFALSLKRLIFIQTDKDISKLDNTQLCVYVNQFLKNYPKQQFWTMLSELIAGKTARQLYDYYTNSFSKFLFSGQLSTEDKVVIRLLNEKMLNQKPSEVAQAFLDKWETQQYFKHNIIMYVVNLRK